MMFPASLKNFIILFLFLFTALKSIGQKVNADACIGDMIQKNEAVGISVAVVKKGKMKEVLSFDNNGPPEWLINKLRTQIQLL